MVSITAQPKTKEQFEAVKAFLKALKIPFQKSEESSYNPEFVEKIRKSEKSVKEGRIHKIALDEIWK